MFLATCDAKLHSFAAASTAIAVTTGRTTSWIAAFIKEHNNSVLVVSLRLGRCLTGIGRVLAMCTKNTTEAQDVVIIMIKIIVVVVRSPAIGTARLGHKAEYSDGRYYGLLLLITTAH